MSINFSIAKSTVTPFCDANWDPQDQSRPRSTASLFELIKSCHCLFTSMVQWTDVMVLKTSNNHCLELYLIQDLHYRWVKEFDSSSTTHSGVASHSRLSMMPLPRHRHLLKMHHVSNGRRKDWDLHKYIKLWGSWDRKYKTWLTSVAKPDGAIAMPWAFNLSLSLLWSTWNNSLIIWSVVISIQCPV